MLHHKLTLAKYEVSSTYICKSEVNKTGQQAACQFRSELRVILRVRKITNISKITVRSKIQLSQGLFDQTAKLISLQRLRVRSILLTERNITVLKYKKLHK